MSTFTAESISANGIVAFVLGTSDGESLRLFEDGVRVSDLSAITRWTATLAGVTVDSDDNPECFDWTSETETSGDLLVLKFGTLDLDLGDTALILAFYNPTYVNGKQLDSIIPASVQGEATGPAVVPTGNVSSSDVSLSGMPGKVLTDLFDGGYDVTVKAHGPWYDSRGAASFAAAVAAAEAAGKWLFVGANTNIAAPITASTLKRLECAPGVTITVDATVGEASALTIGANGAVVKGCTIVGDQTGFANASTKLQRTIDITADDVTVEGCTISNSVYGIYTTGERTRILNNTITNDTIKAGAGDFETTNYSAAIAGDDLHDALIQGNRTYGHGQGIGWGSDSHRIKVLGNFIESADDNGLYGSSGSNNLVEGNVFLNCDGTSIKMRGSRNKVIGNSIVQLTGTMSTFGVSLTPTSVADPDTGESSAEDSIVANNTIYSNNWGEVDPGVVYGVGIGVGANSGQYLDKVIISGNTLTGNIAYGIRILGNPTKGAVIANNILELDDSLVAIGVYGISGGATAYNVAITGNQVLKAVPVVTDPVTSQAYGLKLANVSRAIVSDNLFQDCGGLPNGADYLELDGVTNSSITNNRFVETSAGLINIGIVEATAYGSNSGNYFAGNTFVGTPNRYVDVASGPVKGAGVYTASSAATIGIYQGFELYAIAMTTTSKAVNPAQSWGTGSLIKIYNSGAHDFTFDATGAAFRCAAGRVTEFLYDGSAWKPVWVETVTYSLTTGAKLGSTGAGWTVNDASDRGGLAKLPAGQSGSTLVVPLTGLPVGYTITGYTVRGQVESAGNTATLDAALRSLTVATADLTDAAVTDGAITQVSVTADAQIASAVTGLSSVLTAGKTYYLLITGTTAANTDFDLSSVDVTVRP